MNLRKLQNYIPLPLRIVQDISLQSHRSCACSCDCVYPLLSPYDRLPPMIIRKTVGSATVMSSIKVYNENDVFIQSLPVSIFTTWTPGGVNPFLEDIGYFLYKGTPIPQLNCGKYYLEINFDTGGIITVHYTELFETKDPCCLSRIEWGNKTDEDMIPYASENFKGILYLLTETTTSYKEVSTSKQNEFGLIYDENSRVEEWVSLQICQGYCYLLQSLLAMKNKTYKRFFKASTGESADILDMDITSEPNSNDECLCYFDIKFRQDQIAEMSSCDNAIPKTFMGHDYLTPAMQPACEVCDSVVGLTASLVTAIPNNNGFIDAIVTWGAVDGATSYSVSYNGITTNTTNTSIVLTLTECTAYTICVVAQCASGNSDPSCIMIETPNRVCPTVVNPVVETIDQSSIALSWIATLYDVIVEWKPISEVWNNAYSATVVAGSTGFIITGLDDCTAYNIRVRQDCTSFVCPIEGQWVTLTVTTTLCCDIGVNITHNDDLDCDTISTNITISAVSITNLPYVGNYSIVLYAFGNNTPVSSSVNTPLITNITAGTYTVEFGDTDYDCYYTQNFSLEINCDCVVPASLLSSNITDNAAQLDWSDVAPATSYTLQYRDINSSIWITLTGITVSAYSLTGLLPCTTYEFRVKSICDSVESDWSVLSIFTTTGCNGGGGTNNCNNNPSLSFQCTYNTELGVTCITATDTGTYSSVGTVNIEFSEDGANWVADISNSMCSHCGGSFYVRNRFSSDDCPTMIAIYLFENMVSCTCYKYTNLITSNVVVIDTDCTTINCCVDDVVVYTYCDCDLKRCYAGSPDSDNMLAALIDAYGDYTIELYEFTINGSSTLPTQTVVVTLNDINTLNYEHIACGFDYYPIELQILLHTIGSYAIPNFKVHYWDTCDDNLYASPFRIECCQGEHIVFKWRIYAGGNLFWDCVFDSNVGTTFNGTISNVPLNCYNADPITNKFMVENHADISMAFSIYNQCVLCLRWDGIPLQMGEPYLCEVSLNGSPLAPAVFTENHLIRYNIPDDLPAGINTWIAKLTYTPNGDNNPTVITKNITFNNIGACDNGLITIF